MRARWTDFVDYDEITTQNEHNDCVMQSEDGKFLSNHKFPHSPDILTLSNFIDVIKSKINIGKLGMNRERFHLFGGKYSANNSSEIELRYDGVDTRAKIQCKLLESLGMLLLLLFQHTKRTLTEN